MIVTYKDEYFEEVSKLCLDFGNEYKQFNPDFQLDFNRCRELCKDAYCLLLIEADEVVGILGGIVANSLISFDLIFQEVIFYVKPEYRNKSLALLKTMQDILIEDGVKLMAMNAPSSDNIDIIGRFYNIQGFKELERIYLKRLQ